MKILLLWLAMALSLPAGEFVQKQSGVDSRGQAVYTWVYQADKKFRRERGVTVLPSSGYGATYGYSSGYGYGYGAPVYGAYPYSFALTSSRPWLGPCLSFAPGSCAVPASAWLGPLVLRYSRGN